MQTVFPRKEDIQRSWYVLDAAGIPVGRIATVVAQILMGKRNPAYTPHLDMGDHVIVVNAGKVVFTGKKAKYKVYWRHSSRPGSLKQISAEQLLAKHPTRPLELAIKGMMPKTKLGRQMLKKLRVYAGPDHQHEAQQPETITI
jgi:large subunit ribosomal protein L13